VVDLQSYFREKQARIDEGLRSLLTTVGNGCPPPLLEAMRYSLLAPGKRLRPILVLMAAEACSGDEARAVPAGCAVEMIHTYSLVHDDLPAMDDDDLRRGLPTCHKKFGEATAILVGDALLTYAFEVLARHYPAATAAACCRELARASGAAGMVGGQAEDLSCEKHGGDLHTLMELHGKKTGALFRACLKLGVLAVQGEDGPDPALLEALDNYGRCFGLAFQITDDLLDVEGNAEQTGKRVGKDAGRGKLTYPALLGIAESRNRAAALQQEADRHLQIIEGSSGRLKELFRFVLERNR
jgi:geranylgeranyl diphosphate synthase type II